MQKNQKEASEKVSARIKAQALRTADKIPLPVHYLLNAAFVAILAGDIIAPDAIPFLDEALGAAGFYYYNMYLLRRTLARLKAPRRPKNAPAANVLQPG